MVQRKLADMYARTSLRLMVYRAAEEAQRAPRGGKGTELTKKAAAAVLFAAETAMGCDQAYRFMAAMGTALNSPSRNFGGMPSSMK